VCTKKTKKCHVRSCVTELKKFFFTGATEKCFFFWKLVYQHKMSRCTCKNLVYNFLTLWNVDSHNGSIYSYEPKCISPFTLVPHYSTIYWYNFSTKSYTIVFILVVLKAFVLFLPLPHSRSYYDCSSKRQSLLTGSAYIKARYVSVHHIFLLRQKRRTWANNILACPSRWSISGIHRWSKKQPIFALVVAKVGRRDGIFR
jgi:hypothetical protein